MARTFKASLFGACALLVVSGGAEAQSPKVWRHGMVEAKSDAGFVMMAGKGGFAEKQGVKLAKEMTDAKPDDARAAFVFDEVAKYRAVDPEMPIPMEKLVWMMELFVRTENLAKPMDLSKFIDAGPRQKALAAVNKQAQEHPHASQQVA